MKKVNGIIVYEEDDTCALDEYSAQLAIDLQKKFDDNKYDDIESKQDIAYIQQEQTVQNTNIKTNTDNIETLQQEKAELELECERLREDLNNAIPTVSDSGENITLNGTAEARFKELEISGNSYRDEEKSEIRNVEGNVNFTICNKNLFKLSESVDISTFFRPNHGNVSLSDEMIEITTTEYNSTSLVKGVFIRIADIKNMIPLDFSKEVIFSFEIKRDAGSTIPFKLSNVYNDKTINLTENYQRISISVLKNSDNDAITLYTNADNRSFYIRNIQLEYKTEASDYEEHKEQSFTVPVQQEMLKEDKIDLENKKEIHNWKYYLLNGTETISYYDAPNKAKADSSETAYFSIALPQAAQNDAMLINNVLSTKFKNIACADELWNTNLEEGIALQTRLRLRIKKSRLSGWSNDLTSDEKVNLLKNYLTANNIPIWYKPATPTELTLTQEQIEVLNNIKKTAKSYKGTTNIFSTDEVSPIFDVEALRDLNVLFTEVTT